MVATVQERRHSIRYTSAEIPQNIHGISITTASNSSYLGKLLDISSEGMKVYIPDFLNDSREVSAGKSIRISFVNTSFSVNGQCVHNDNQQNILYIGLFIQNADEQLRFAEFIRSLGLI